MSDKLRLIIRTISPINNHYRDPATPIPSKLEALWEIGDKLIKYGVTRPHSIGWAIQRETRGLIKRPTVFRSHKVRSIWESRQALIADLGRLKHLSHLTDILPLIDPAQSIRGKLTSNQINEIFTHACSDPPRLFRQYISELKSRFSYGKLGKSLDRTKHLPKLDEIKNQFMALRALLLKILDERDSGQRETFRTSIPSEELKSFSNMCISLTTKDNLRLYKSLGPAVPRSSNQLFTNLYSYFRAILEKISDVERARVRRVISADALAQMSDMVSSIMDEDSVEDFRSRRKLAIKL